MPLAKFLLMGFWNGHKMIFKNTAQYCKKWMFQFIPHNQQYIYPLELLQYQATDPWYCNKLKTLEPKLSNSSVVMHLSGLDSGVGQFIAERYDLGRSKSCKTKKQINSHFRTNTIEGSNKKRIQRRKCSLRVCKCITLDLEITFKYWCCCFYVNHIRS